MAQIKLLKPGVYNITVYLGKDNQGRRITKSKVFKGKKREAEQFAKVYETQLKQNKNLNSLMLMKDYLEYWLEEVKPEIEERTYETYSYHVKRLIPLIGDIQLIELRVLLLKERLKPLNQELSPKTLKGIYATLRTAIRRAVVWELLSRDVTIGLTPPRNYRKERTVLNRSQLNKLRETAKGYKHYAIILLLATTGMRIGEALGLKWKDFKASKGTITIQRAVNTKSRQLKDEPKTFNSLRTIKLSEDVILALKTLKPAQDKKISPIRSDDLIFNENGRPLRANSVRNSLNRILKKAGLPHIRIHDLRHTVVSILLEDGFSLAYVANLIGDTIETVTKTYAHLVKTGVGITDSYKNSENNSEKQNIKQLNT